MRDQRHRLIVVSRRAAEPPGPQQRGQILHTGQCARLGLLAGRGNPGAARKQAFNAGFDPGLGRSGHGMTRHKPLVQPLPDLEHRLLDRPHIGEHRLLRDRRHQSGVRLEQTVKREGQDNQCAVAEHCRIGAHQIGKPPLPGPLSGLGSVHQGLDSHAMTPEIKRDRAPDQPQTHDADGRRAPGTAVVRVNGHGQLGLNSDRNPASYDSRMLEASAHQQLKALLRQEGAEVWPHHLSLCRLVGRSLRRADHSLIRLAMGTPSDWWISLLVPLALSPQSLVLVVSDRMRQRLLQVELPRLQRAGLPLACAEGDQAPPHGVLWLMNHGQLIRAWAQERLADRQLVLPEAEQLETRLRQALAVTLTPADWDRLRRALPGAESSLLQCHERLSRKVLASPRNPSSLVGLDPSELAPLRQLLAALGPLPPPWGQWLSRSGDTGWCCWAEVNPALLQWTLQCQPLEPLAQLAGLVEDRGAIVIGQLAAQRKGGALPSAALTLGLRPHLDLQLGEAPLADPLPLYAPLRQPLPNSPIYAEHLLSQCRRLMLGRERLSVVLVDDPQLRLQLTSALAADFGSRVVHESLTPESNGVICARWFWWLEHHERLPHPEQIVIGLLPIASLEDPLTAARVAVLRGQGRDWFRELLLPDALALLQRVAAPLRQACGAGTRLAILDGRMRGRSWGQAVLQSLEPWMHLSRLLPP